MPSPRAGNPTKALPVEAMATSTKRRKWLGGTSNAGHKMSVRIVRGTEERETSRRLGMRSGQPRDKQPGECALDRGFSVGHKRCCMSTCFILDKRPVERGWRKPLPSRRSNLGASVSKPSIGPPLLAQTGEGRRRSGEAGRPSWRLRSSKLGASSVRAALGGG